MKRLTLALLMMAAGSNAFARGANSGYWGRKGGNSSNDNRGSGSSYYDDSSSSARSSSPTDSPSRDGSRGGDRSDRNLASGILHEAQEHALRRFVATDAPTEANNLVASVVEYAAATQTAIVVLSTVTKDYTYNCIVFDDLSRSGTIIKKELRCTPSL